MKKILTSMSVILLSLFAAVALPTQSSRAEVQVNLPADELPHKEPIEWWYYSGHLEDEQGRRYGVMAAFFAARMGNFPPAYFMIYHLSEKDEKKYRAGSVLGKNVLKMLKMFLSGLPEDLLEKVPPDLFDEEKIKQHHRFMKEKAKVRPDRLGLKFGEQTFIKTKEESENWADWMYKTRLVDDKFTVELEMTPTRGPMYVGGEGNVGMAQGENMYYYSLTRLASEGTITMGGEERKVRGTVWYDHQYGSFGREVKPVGWDWFCIQLEDGTDLNLSALRWPETGERFNELGTIMKADGSTTIIHDLIIEEQGKWTSPDTGITYPSGWILKIPSQEMEFVVTPEFPEQEMQTFGPMHAIWEGACGVEATVGGESMTGDGYTELVGYAVEKEK